MLIKFPYDEARDMRIALAAGIDDLAKTKAQVSKIVATIGEGALVGMGGSALADALGSVLVRKIDEITDKLEEMIRDLEQSEQLFRQKDGDTAGAQGM
ncbi:MAG: hypothetical protein MUF38_08420 [Anaerolineae bacterium]|jgi:polyhydroxyalkanoate synthesis regulator phasin|nr:hypothetical protein [Anaerolineae bacterium]